MDSINSWLDVEELNRLAAALMAPVEEPKVVKSELTPEHGRLARGSASAVLSKASEIAKRAGVIPPSVREAALPELSDWLSENARCQGLCVVDRDGDVLQAAMPREEWTKLTVSAAIARFDDAESGPLSLRLKVAAESFLQYISVVTDRGPLLVGLLTQNVLKDRQLLEFASLLERISASDQVQ